MYLYEPDTVESGSAVQQFAKAFASLSDCNVRRAKLDAVWLEETGPVTNRKTAARRNRQRRPGGEKGDFLIMGDGHVAVNEKQPAKVPMLLDEPLFSSMLRQ